MLLNSLPKVKQRLLKAKADAAGAGQATPSASASKGDGHPHWARVEEVAPLPDWGAQGK